jgi:hypothetical protein
MKEKAKQLGNSQVSGYGYAAGTSYADIPGMTLREYYAGLAMQGIITSKQYLLPANVAKQAILQADILLEELSKE